RWLQTNGSRSPLHLASIDSRNKSSTPSSATSFGPLLIANVARTMAKTYISRRRHSAFPISPVKRRFEMPSGLAGTNTFNRKADRTFGNILPVFQSVRRANLTEFSVNLDL